MNALPVIIRELRLQARSGRIHQMRVVSAVALTGTLAWLVFGYQGSAPQAGNIAFVAIHTVVLLLIGIFVPIPVADTVAREKRDGTLGLLLLTRLKAHDVAIAKGLIHALRAASILLAAIPIMVIPLMQGGVQWMDLITAMIFEACALLAALAGGIVASSLAESSGYALFLSIFISSALVSAIAIATFVGFYLQSHMLFPGTRWNDLSDLRNLLFASLRVFSGQGLDAGTWSGALGAASPRRWIWCAQLIESLLLSGAVLMLALRFAARSTEAGVRGSEPAFWRRWLSRAATARIFSPSLFTRKMSRHLHNNPVVWLHAYNWRARIVKWCWCYGIILFEIALFGHFSSYRSLFEFQPFVAMLLGFGGLAVGAARSFRRERELGAFELLLVTPITEKELILGRLAALYLDFLPALIVVIGCAIAGTFEPIFAGLAIFDRSIALAWFLWVAVNCYLLFPLFGLSYCAQVANSFVVWMIVCALGTGYGLLEIVAAGQVSKAIHGAAAVAGRTPMSFWVSVGVVIAILALVQMIAIRFCWFALRLRLNRQAFAGMTA